MKPKRTATDYTSEREKLRQATAYGSARIWAGVILIVSGCLAILAAPLALGVDVALAVSLLFGGIFQFILLAVLGAIFDLADAALAAKRSDEARTIREVGQLRSRAPGEEEGW